MYYPVSLIRFLLRLLLCYSSRKIFHQPCWFSFKPTESNLKGVFQQSTFLFEYHFIPVFRRLCSTTHGLCSTFLSSAVLSVFTPIRMNPTLESSIPGPGPASPALNHPDSGLGLPAEAAAVCLTPPLEKVMANNSWSTVDRMKLPDKSSSVQRRCGCQLLSLCDYTPEQK